MPPFFFFFNHTSTTEIYTLSLHDALPIYYCRRFTPPDLFTVIDIFNDTRLKVWAEQPNDFFDCGKIEDRKSTRLNSSHANISYAVFCLKKKTQTVIPFDSVSN